MTNLTPIPSTKFTPRKGPLVLIIMDGIGLGKPTKYNAVYQAKMPHLNNLMSTPLYTPIKAHGTAVGMPTDDDMGNSEVGHNTLGAGRIFPQGAKLVQQAFKNGTLFKSQTWNTICQRSGTLHLIGLLSDGNVHSHIDHFNAILCEAATRNIQNVNLHILLDGRDVDPRSALTYIQKIESSLTKINTANPGFHYQIASGGGRMVITMDRYNADWPMVKQGWDTHVLGKGPGVSSAAQAVEAYYQQHPTGSDQYCPPFVIQQNGEPVGKMKDGDSVIFVNFRGDRAIELSMAFDDPHFNKFDRETVPNVFFAGMMEYDGDLKLPKHYLVDRTKIDRPMSEYICAEHIPSFAISETQKYGHVTYFWNGNNSDYIDKTLETYIEIPSDNRPFDEQPAMKAYEITDKTIDLLKSGRYKFGRINFPNGDMVGHTGDLSAAITACEVTDDCVGKIIDVVNELNGITLILADHGNADEMAKEKDGVITPVTSHTLNPVPFIIVDSGYKNDYTLNKLDTPGLSNVAATIFNLLGFDKPEDYDDSLIHFN